MPNNSDELNERRDLAGSTNTTTYHREAQIALGLENQGRWGQTAGVIGSVADAGSQYPRLPGNNPHAFDPVPSEEPLGWSVEDQVAVGNPDEISASLDALELAASATTPSDASDVTSLVTAIPGEVTGDGKPTPAIGFPDNNDNSVLLPSALPSGLPSPTNSPQSTSTVIRRRHGL